MHIHTYKHCMYKLYTSKQTNIHTYVCTYVQAYMHIALYVHTYVHTYSYNMGNCGLPDIIIYTQTPRAAGQRAEGVYIR